MKKPEGTVQISVRVPAAIMAEIDRIASLGAVPASRTAVVLAALEAGLKTLGRKAGR